MDFSKMRHRIVFMKPLNKRTKNAFGENVTEWQVFKPGTESSEVICISDSGGLYDAEGLECSFDDVRREYAVWALVAPKTGREYDEAQRLRAETTYNITTRCFVGLSTKCRIMYNGRVFKIESILDINERHERLTIVASEVASYG